MRSTCTSGWREATTPLRLNDGSRLPYGFGLSLRNLIRRFKDATEQTPMQYLQELRIEKAKLLLESSQTAFDQITLQVGYEDGNSFRRLFKQRVGLAPSAYRKRFSSQRC